MSIQNGQPASANDFVSVSQGVASAGKAVLLDERGKLGSTLFAGTRPNVKIFTAPTGIATISIASPAVITKAAHGYSIGDTVMFTSTGVLPTGVSVNTPYYIISAGFTTNSFQISATLNGAAINTSGTQSGAHTLSYAYIPTPGTRMCQIRGAGAGGGGGGSYNKGGNGAGPGGYFEDFLVPIFAFYQVIVGAAGPGGPYRGNGSDGGKTQIDNLIAFGGYGGYQDGYDPGGNWSQSGDATGAIKIVGDRGTIGGSGTFGIGGKNLAALANLGKDVGVGGNGIYSSDTAPSGKDGKMIIIEHS